MINFFKRIFGASSTDVEEVNFKQLYEKGAILLDVRTPQEFASGHIDGALNFPIQNIEQNLDAIRKLNKPVIAYCRSGARSGRATKILNNNGIKTVNGGAFIILNDILK